MASKKNSELGEISVSVNGGEYANIDSPEAREMVGEVVRRSMGTESEADIFAPIEQPVRIRGKLLKTLIKTCCRPPKKDQPESALNSIGVGIDSIAATDTYVAVRIGTQDESYRATSRRAALLESEREMLYTDTAKFEHVEPLLKPDGSGEVEPFPNIDKVLGQIAGMKYVGSLNPALLLKAAQIAVAGNAPSIELYSQGDSLIGFEFQVMPDEEQFDLFQGAVDPIPSCGVIVARSKSASDDQDEEGD